MRYSWAVQALPRHNGGAATAACLSASERADAGGAVVCAAARAPRHPSGVLAQPKYSCPRSLALRRVEPASAPPLRLRPSLEDAGGIGAALRQGADFWNTK